MRSKVQDGGTVQSSAGVGGGPQRDSLARHDLAQARDLALRRVRMRRTVTISVFATILGVGIVALVTNPSDRFALIAIALILLGGINCAVSAVGLWRVIGEQRMRESDRLDVASRPANGRSFDQTNGIVDLGHDSEQPDADDEADRARRLSSMNAAGIAYGNGTR